MNALSDAQATAAALADHTNVQIVGSEDGAINVGGGMYCEELCLRLGSEPSTASIVVPFNSSAAGTTIENADTLAWDYDGFSAGLKHGMKVRVETCQAKLGDNGQTTFTNTLAFIGYVTGIARDRDKDCLVIHCHDIRQFLKDIAIVGRWIQNASQHASFQQGWDAHFNPQGRPNCIFTSENPPVPVFSEYPDYGLEDNEEPPAATVHHVSKACYWTLANMLTYLRTFFDASYVYPAIFGWIPKAHPELEWSVNFGACLDTLEVQNFEGGVGQATARLGGARKGRDINLAGRSFLDAITTILETCGGYALNCTYSKKKGTTTMDVVSTIARGEGSVLGYRGVGAVYLPGAYITGGTVFEDSSETITQVAGRGSKILIERVFRTDDGSLVAAWSSAREAAFLKMIVDQYNTDAAYEMACAEYPEVFTTWKVTPGYDIQAGTSQSAYPLSSASRPPWPTLLSWMTGVEPIATKASGSVFPGHNLPIYFEVKTTVGASSYWNLVPELNGLEVYDNGIIYIPTLRDLGVPLRCWSFADTGLSPKPPWTPTVNGKADLRIRDLRMVCAVPCDHGRSKAFCLPGFGTVTGELTDGPKGPDSALLDPEFRRPMFIDLSGLYDYWERYQSYPLYPYGVSGTGAERYTAKTGILRNDTDLIESHIKRHLYYRGRVVRVGSLRYDGYLVNCYPGFCVSSLTCSGKTDLVVNSVVHEVRFTSKAGEPPTNTTELILA